jgi:hypothetical protein
VHTENKIPNPDDRVKGFNELRMKSPQPNRDAKKLEPDQVIHIQQYVVSVTEETVREVKGMI